MAATGLAYFIGLQIAFDQLTATVDAAKCIGMNKSMNRVSAIPAALMADMSEESRADDVPVGLQDSVSFGVFDTYHRTAAHVPPLPQDTAKAVRIRA